MTWFITKELTKLTTQPIVPHASLEDRPLADQRTMTVTRSAARRVKLVQEVAEAMMCSALIRRRVSL